MPKETYMGQIILGQTYLPRHPAMKGKLYFWMQDGDGVVYLAKVGEDGRPDFS